MDGALDPKPHSEIALRDKKQIRARMKALRGEHSIASLSQRSKKIVARLLHSGALNGARSVALFWPMEGRGEVDLRPLDLALRERGVTIYYPFMEPKPEGGFASGFRLTESPDELEERGQKFFEPSRSRPVAQRGEIDAVIVPALAVDTRGHRVGYGAGYYDATLRDVCPPATAIIVAYQFQVTPEVPSEPHDVPCQYVVTDEDEMTT